MPEILQDISMERKSLEGGNLNVLRKLMKMRSLRMISASPRVTTMVRKDCLKDDQSSVNDEDLGLCFSVTIYYLKIQPYFGSHLRL